MSTDAKIQLLKQLAELKATGILTEEEFQEEKKSFSQPKH